MKLGVIGTGKMGGALIRGIIESGALAQQNIILYNRSREALDSLIADYTSLTSCASPQDLYNQADVIILAVKPGGICPMLSDISGKTTTSPLIISVAAGITLEQMQQAAGSHARIIRVMPNTPALVGKGVLAYVPGMMVNQNDCDLLESLFKSSGLVIKVDEVDIDAVSAISGCGPAYMFVILDALCEAGVAMGLKRELAKKLAMKTMEGSAILAKSSDKHLMELRDEVTSPGGSTIAALNAMEQTGIRHSIIHGTKSAFERTKEMGK